MPEWLTIWLPVVAVFLTAVVTHYVAIPRQYQRARAELAYTEYIKNKNEAYQKLYEMVKETEGRIGQIMPGLISKPLYNRHNLEDMKRYMKEIGFTDFMTETVIKAWDNKDEGRDKAIERFEEYEKEINDVNRKHYIGKLHSFILLKRIFLSEDVFDKVMNIRDKFHQIIELENSVRWNKKDLRFLPVGKERSKYVSEMKGKADEKNRIWLEARNIINGNDKNKDEQQMCLVDIMRNELDQTNLSISKSKK